MTQEKKQNMLDLWDLVKNARGDAQVLYNLCGTLLRALVKANVNLGQLDIKEKDEITKVIGE